MSFVWASVPAAMITPSTPEPNRASSESTPSTPWAPNRSTIVLVFSGTRSVTTSESIAGIPTSVLVWNAPIRPSHESEPHAGAFLSSMRNGRSAAVEMGLSAC